MTEEQPAIVTLDTLHRDLSELKGDVRDVKGLLIAGLQAFPPEWPREVVRLLREGNRLNEERFAQLDITLREQALDTHTILRALAEGQQHVLDGQRQVLDGQRQVLDSQRQMLDSQGGLSADIRALIARIDALIRRRENGSPPS